MSRPPLVAARLMCAVVLLVPSLGAAGSAHAPRSYCGIYSLYAAAEFLGKPQPIDKLLVPKYLGSEFGSSMKELEQAARDSGLEALALGGLTTLSLRESPYPMILHVKLDPSRTHCDHWILYYGSSHGFAQTYDPAHGFAFIPFDDVATRWDGKALVLSSAPIEASKLSTPARWHLFGAVLGAVALLALLRYMPRSSRWALPREMWRRHMTASAQVCGLLGAAGLAAVGYHLLSESGFARHAQAVESVQQANVSAFLSKVDVAGARGLAASGVLFIDARFPADFSRGHIPGAVNLPVNSDLSRYEAVLASAGPERDIVVYCQSRSCSFAKQVAAILYGRGKSHVMLFPGGWEAWEASERSS
jgi:rhodanese-related sulfurtransferase